LDEKKRKSGYLHDVIAIEQDRKQLFERITAETEKDFVKRSDLFTGEVKTVEVLKENETRVENSTTERTMTTTVIDKLKYTGKHIATYMDAVYQKEEANQRAKADLEVDGVTIQQDVPVSFLLNLESRLRRIRHVVGLSPTLPSGLSWVEEAGTKNVWHTKAPKRSYKTAKEPKSKVLAKAEGQHPAQIEKWFEDIPIARIEVTEISGMLTSEKKAAILDKLDKLIQATVRARQHANRVEVDGTRKIGKLVFDYLLG